MELSDILNVKKTPLIKSYLNMQAVSLVCISLCNSRCVFLHMHSLQGASGCRRGKKNTMESKSGNSCFEHKKKAGRCSVSDYMHKWFQLCQRDRNIRGGCFNAVVHVIALLFFVMERKKKNHPVSLMLIFIGLCSLPG